MPLKKTHQTAGAIVGIGTAIAIICLANKGMMPAVLFKGGQIDSPTYISLAMILSLIGGCLPDWIEPSSRGPRHRRFFHSSLLLVGLILINFLIALGVILPRPEQFILRTCLFFFAAGYISHLVLDKLSSIIKRL